MGALKLNYRIFGEKPVSLVIEMGLGACISEWMPIANQLAKTYGILLYERAGINRSEESSQSRTPRHIAEELYELLKQIPHTDRIILLAHSQGGLYAQQFCRLYPEFIQGVVLLDPLSATDYQFRETLSEGDYKKSGVDKSSAFRIMYCLAKGKLGWITRAIVKNAPPFYYFKDFTKEQRQDILGSMTKPIHAKTALQEYEEAHKREHIELLQTKEGFPSILLILVTHSSPLAIEESMQFGNNTREFATKIE